MQKQASIANNNTFFSVYYSTFGMLMPGRNSGEDYRFGFGSMERDDEIKGNGNSYDYGARMLDPRVGRWLSNDPAFHDYPSISPYVFAINSPNWFIDPNGKWVVEIQKNGEGKYQLVFIAEVDDNLTTLATQLGLDKDVILEAQPELDGFEITTSVELKLSKIQQVSDINSGINFISENNGRGTNCSNLADYSDGGTNLEFNKGGSGNVGILEYKLGNSEDFESEEAIELFGIVDKYTSVSEEDSRIGDIIMYKIDESSKEALEKLEGVSKAADVMKNERHFSIVVLKDKSGEKPAFILQKNGDVWFDFKVDPADDLKLPGTTIQYTEAIPAGAETPINRRVNTETEEK